MQQQQHIFDDAQKLCGFAYGIDREVFPMLRWQSKKLILGRNILTKILLA